jgi:hypothetical protein
MGMTRIALALAALTLVPLACNLPKSKSFGEDKAAAAGSPAAAAGASNATANTGAAAGQGDRPDRGGSSNPGSAGTRDTEVPAVPSGAGGSVDAGGAVATGGSLATGGTVATGGTFATGGSLATGGTVATGGSLATGGIPATGGVEGKDAGPNGGTDASVGPDAGAEAGGPPTGTAALVLGNLLPMAETGTFPLSMALGDVNGDGKLDVVTINVGLPPESVSVQLGRGDGSFGSKSDYEVDYQPQQLALGDLNGDRKLDILTVCYYGSNDVPNVVDVLLGNGDGTFAAKQAYATADGPQALVLGDLDADGNLDVITADQWTDQVSVFLGNGDGTLATRHDYATGGGPSALALADVNRDGKLDLVVAATGTGWRESSSVSVLLGNGDGTLGDATDFPFDVPAIRLRGSVALGDLNGDDELDVVVGTAWGDLSNPDSASVLLGNGDGTFASSVSLPRVDSPSSIRIFDVNEDGKLDLLFTSDDRVSLLLGQGDGTFPNRVEYPTGGRLEALDLGDLNGDGEPDLALTFDSEFWRSGLGVLFATGGGEFSIPAALPTADYADGVAVGDLDGDGKLDIATANSAVDRASVWLGKGNGTFAARKDYVTGDAPTIVALGNVDGDGRADLVTLNSAAETVSVLLGKGQGTLAAKVDYPTASAPVSAALGDVNGDATLDIVTTNTASDFYDNGTVNVLLGNGNGAFAAPVDTPVGSHPTSLALGDLDGDDKLDLVVANQGAGDMVLWSVGVLLGNGDGTFSAAADASADRARSVALTDLNGDGKLDLLMALDNGPEVHVLLGNGDGTFAPSVAYPTWDSVNSFAFGDMNGDDNQDVVAAASGAIDVLLGMGDGTLAPRLSYAASPGSMALGDFDGNGRLDVATATYPSSLGVLLNSPR